MAAKKLTPQQQRDRRAKIMLGVLGAVFALVMVIELPSLLGGKKSPSAAATTTTATTTGATAPAAAPASLASAQVVAAAQPNQLHSFSRFAPKDPFHALVSTTAKAATGSTAGGAAKSGGASSGGAPAAGTTSTAPTITFAQKAPATTAPAGPMVLGAVLKLNGVRRLIAVGSTFPAANPVFKLVAVGRKAIWISLIGGSFGDGHQTLKIMRNHPVKLVNTTASLGYLLKLVGMTMLPKPAAPPATATAPATTSATTSAATTTAATTTTG